jgi:tripartite-type tricarboxylate transporter receptor subunit TctC
MLNVIGRTAALAMGLLLAGSACADAPYPNRPIKLIVAYAPGGGTDVIARIVGRELSQVWSTPVVVENRPGAGSIIGTQVVARSDPDGYTLLVTSTPFSINPILHNNAGYDPIRDFVPIINAGHSPTIVVVSAAIPANNLKELIALAKVQHLSYASAGVGTVPFLTAEYLLRKKAGVDIVHVPYGGAGPALSAVVLGHVAVGVLAYATPGLESWLSSGKLKGIVVTSAKRLAALPAVPTASESGFPGYVDLTWIGFMAPAKTPAPIVSKLNLEINRILELSEVRAQLLKLGFVTEPNSTLEFAKFIQSETEHWADIVKAVGGQVD